MRPNQGFVAAVGLASALALAASGTAVRAEEPAAPPGQLKRILSSLKADGPARTRETTEWLLRREYVTQLLHMTTDPRGGMGGGGWYRPSQSRYGWEWLGRRCDRDGDGAITLDEFGGPREWFEALDKDRDGALTRDDLDWSADSPLTKAGTRARALFGQIDRDSNGQVTPEEWKQWFDALGGGRGFLAQDDLVPLFVERGIRGRGPGAPRSPALSKTTRLAVVSSFISGDVGSPSEGPAVNEKAPSFALLDADGKNPVSLSQERIARSKTGRDKPLVLIFGSFT